MKRNYLSIALLLVMILVTSIIACQSTENDDSLLNENLYSYEQVGAIHNEGLEYVFKELVSYKSKARSNFSFSSDLLQTLSSKAVSEFLAKKQVLLPNSRASRTTYSIAEVRNMLNKDQRKYYNKLMNVFFDRNLNYEETQLSIVNITMKIKKNLSTIEADPLLYGASVAKYTAEYWHSNWAKWHIELGDGKKFICSSLTNSRNTPESDNDFSWKEVGAQDVSGAIGGAVGGAIVGGMAGGVGAGPGAATGGIGGGIGNSVASIIGQLIN